MFTCLNTSLFGFVYFLVQVPCPLASKFHVCFNKIRTTSELLVRQSMRISTALSAMLYNSPGWTSLLRFVHKSLCDAGQSELLDAVLQFFSKLDSNGIVDTLCRRSPSAMMLGQVIFSTAGCDPMFWQLPQKYSYLWFALSAFSLCMNAHFLQGRNFLFNERKWRWMPIITGISFRTITRFKDLFLS